MTLEALDIATIAAWAKDITAITAMVALLVKPIRERIFGDKAVREGQQCLLRSEIVRLYYRHQNTQSMREYEFKNMCACYKAYKALGGNSFVEHIYNEMQSWDVTV